MTSSGFILPDLSAMDIDTYFSYCDPLDKAGGYGIQLRGELIVDYFVGLESTVIGLPVEKVTGLLTHACAL